MGVLIVLINYNNARDTISCINGLKNNDCRNCLIFVVDNASTDNSYERLAEFAEQSGLKNILLIRNQINSGFAGGVNKGLLYAIENRFDYVLLLNNDTEVSPDFIPKILQTAGSDDSIGIVGCKILFCKTTKVYSAGGRISFLRNVGHLEHYGKNDSPDLKGEIESSFITGCLMLIKASLVRDIGFFDESYFMYVEDVDFCFRALKKGWKLRTNLDAVIWHKEGASANSEFSAYWASKNRLRFIYKNLSGFGKLRALILHLITKPLLYCKIREPHIILADFKGAIDFYKAN